MEHELRNKKEKKVFMFMFFRKKKAKMVKRILDKRTAVRVRKRMTQARFIQSQDACQKVSYKGKPDRA